MTEELEELEELLKQAYEILDQRSVYESSEAAREWLDHYHERPRAAITFDEASREAMSNNAH